MAGIMDTFYWYDCFLYLGQEKSPTSMRPSLFCCLGKLEGEKVMGEVIE